MTTDRLFPSGLRLASRSGDMTAAQSPRPEQSSQVFKCGAGNDSF